MAKGLIQDNEKKFRLVSPVGYLLTHDQRYFLLNLKPIKPDWENENERRFAVVPTNEVLHWDEKNNDYYSFARHIVTNSYTIEYNPNIAPILIWDLGDIDIEAHNDLYAEGLEAKETNKNSNEEPDWHQLELSDIVRSVEETNG